MVLPYQIVTIPKALQKQPMLSVTENREVFLMTQRSTAEAQQILHTAIAKTIRHNSFLRRPQPSGLFLKCLHLQKDCFLINSNSASFWLILHFFSVAQKRTSTLLKWMPLKKSPQAAGDSSVELWLWPKPHSADWNLRTVLLLKWWVILGQDKRHT